MLNLFFYPKQWSKDKNLYWDLDLFTFDSTHHLCFPIGPCICACEERICAPKTQAKVIYCGYNQPACSNSACCQAWIYKHTCTKTSKHWWLVYSILGGHESSWCSRRMKWHQIGERKRKQVAVDNLMSLISLWPCLVLLECPQLYGALMYRPSHSFFVCMIYDSSVFWFYLPQHFVASNEQLICVSPEEVGKHIVRWIISRNFLLALLPLFYFSNHHRTNWHWFWKNKTFFL